MVRQRKCHTRMRRSLSASGDAVPEGQAAETKLEEGECVQIGIDVAPASNVCWVLLDQSRNVLSTLV